MPPGSILKDFGRHLGVHFEPKIHKIWCWFSMCFWDAFWRDFGVVLGLFWVTFWYKNDDQKQKGRFVEMLVLLR